MDTRFLFFMYYMIDTLPSFNLSQYENIFVLLVTFERFHPVEETVISVML